MLLHSLTAILEWSYQSFRQYQRATIQAVNPAHPIQDDVAVVVLHSGFLFGAHRGDLADNYILGLWLNTDMCR
jgi:hypothetical protein